MQIRADEDTELLAMTVTLDETPALGAYIRNLRLDGGYAKHLQTIVECAPNIQRICINLNVLSKKFSGLLRSLPSLNPVELYTHSRIRHVEDIGPKLSV